MNCPEQIAAIINVYAYGEKPRKNISEDTSGGKPTDVPEGIAEAVEAERARSSREVGLLPTGEENLNDLDLRLLELNRAGIRKEVSCRRKKVMLRH